MTPLIKSYFVPKNMYSKKKKKTLLQKPVQWHKWCKLVLFSVHELFAKVVWHPTPQSFGITSKVNFRTFGYWGVVHISYVRAWHTQWSTSMPSMTIFTSWSGTVTSAPFFLLTYTPMTVWTKFFGLHFLKQPFSHKQKIKCKKSKITFQVMNNLQELEWKASVRHFFFFNGMTS